MFSYTISCPESEEWLPIGLMYQQKEGVKVGFRRLKKRMGIKKGATPCSNLC